ncbi:MAG: hypothetical protein L0241_01490 [Planctomycetia bacterium]|nr:hypothetical protein [Planctomycetia bacterium]
MNPMSEAEWLACGNPESMLKLLPKLGYTSERKFRLFAVACCRLLFSQASVSPHAKRVVDVAERYADEAVPLSEFQTAYRVPLSELQTIGRYTNSAAEYACMNAGEDKCDAVVADCASGNAAWGVAKHGAVPPDDNGLSEAFNARVAAELSRQSDRLRDIFGNPFRPVAFPRAWRTSDVLLLARGIYNDRAFDRMPILADALQDAGCDNVNVLDHCRDKTYHTRGCWVVDLILGKQ